MSYKIQLNQQTFHTERIFCIGRNYVQHIEELQNELPAAPVIFMKPASCLVKSGQSIPYPTHGQEMHHEAEIVVLIGKSGKAKQVQEARTFIAGLSIGIDFTLRDVQRQLKEKGLPWERAKAFDHSAPIGDFIPLSGTIDLTNLDIRCWVNEDLRQEGNSAQMIYRIETLIVELSHIWQLNAGDLIYTGTPAGVSTVKIGDVIRVENSQIGRFEWKITA